MAIFSNFNLVSVGIAIAAIAILGAAVFLSNRRSSTGRAFLLFSIVSVIWSIVNYSQYQTHTPGTSFLILRLVLFLGVWHSFSFFRFCYAFPEESVHFPRWYRFGYLPVAALFSLVTIATPLVFQSIAEVDASGALIKVNNGPLIPLVALLILFSVIGGVILLIKKVFRAPAERKRQFALVLWGMFITFLLLMAFNFILPAFFSMPQYIPLGAIFLLPFVGFTYYAIARYHLLNMKVISTEIIAFLLSVATLLEILISHTLAEVMFRAAIFILVLIVSIFLIRSVRKEVEQREELERLDKQLEEKNAQLDELSHFKSELLSLASHQIRSPLAAMKGFMSLIMDGTYGAIDPRAKEALGKTQKSAEELIGLINTLLDVRKVEEGKMEYSFAKTDMRKMAQDVFALLEPLAVTKTLEFKLTAPDHEVFVNADAEKLKQVVQNLTDNAIKYTPSGFVHMELSEEIAPGAGSAPNGSKIGTATLTVSDSGYGISAELVPHLFEEFMRDEKVKKLVRGTGLGLFIARKIAEAHGGKIWAESPGEGKGSSFHLSVPIVKFGKDAALSNPAANGAPAAATSAATPAPVAAAPADAAAPTAALSEPAAPANPSTPAASDPAAPAAS